MLCLPRVLNFLSAYLEESQFYTDRQWSVPQIDLLQVWSQLRQPFRPSSGQVPAKLRPSSVIFHVGIVENLTVTYRV
jgi:hypothetical protein